MQPNGTQNYWQPQAEDTSGAPPQPPVVVPQVPTPIAPVAPPTPSPAITPSAAPELPVAESDAFSWESSEYIDHRKDALWFIGFAVIVLACLGLAIWTQTWTLVGAIVIMAIAMLVYVSRPPRIVRYSLSSQGIHIGQQLHAYSEFRAFDVVSDGPFFAIILVSTKRFMPARLIYFAEADGDQIVAILGNYLPMEDIDLDLVDIILRRLRL